MTKDFFYVNKLSNVELFSDSIIKCERQLLDFTINKIEYVLKAIFSHTWDVY